MQKEKKNWFYEALQAACEYGAGVFCLLNSVAKEKIRSKTGFQTDESKMLFVRKGNDNA